MKTLRHLTTMTFVLVLAAGCTSAAGSTPAHRSGSTTRTITDRDKGTTVPLHVGDHLKVILASTYWTIQPASNRAVLRSDGRPVTKGKLQGCVPGAGCGTTTETFTAVKDGKATVSASRTTCGEALLCTGGNGEYKVSVVVK
jgi:hypothetical protein